MKQIAIVGCGPAGLSAAIALHDAGFNITLFERFDRPAPIGSGLMLQPTGLNVLEQLGLRDQVEQLGQRIDGMTGRTVPADKLVLNINYQALAGDIYGVAIHRASLFHVLYQAVLKRKISLRTGCEVTGLSYEKPQGSAASKAVLHLADGNSIDRLYDLVVDASGSQSKLLTTAINQPQRRLLAYGAIWTTVALGNSEFSRNLLEQRYKGAKMMAGVLPCGRLPDQPEEIATLFWSLKCSQQQAVEQAGIQRWKKQLTSHWPAVQPLSDQISGFDELTFARYSHHTLKKPWGRSIAFIGDAAHSTSPQLGQGVNMALLDTAALTAALTATTINSGKDDTLLDRLQLYAHTRRTHVRLFQSASYLLTSFYQSDSTVMPLLRDTLFEPISKLPFVDQLVTRLGAGLLSNPLGAIARIDDT